MSMGTGPGDPGRPDDPYAPPRNEPGAPARTLLAGVVPYDLGAILEATWRIYKANLGAVLAIGWTVLGLLVLSQYLQRLIARDLAPDPGDRAAYFLSQFGSFFAAWVFNSWLTIGQNLALLAVARGIRPSFPRLYQGFPFLLTTLLAGVLFALAVGVVGLLFLVWVPILGGVAGPASPAMVVIQAAGIVAALTSAVAIGLRLSQYHLMIVDAHAGIADSLRYSWQATEHRWATLLLVWLLLLTINLAGILACFVGLLFTIPFTNLLLVMTFLSLTGQPIGVEQGEPGAGVEFVD